MPKVQKLLRDNGVYLTEHRWAEDIHDISQQGFMLGIDPQFYSPAQAHARISNAVTVALQASSSALHIPRFAVAFCTPQATFNSSTANTKACAIETERSKSVEMKRVLKEAFKKTVILFHFTCDPSILRPFPTSFINIRRSYPSIIQSCSIILATSQFFIWKTEFVTSKESSI